MMHVPDGIPPKGVLLAEDEEELRVLMGMIFEADGFKVFHAADGLQALEIFRDHVDEIGLLVTDLGLPKLGGVELIEQIRTIKPDVKIIGSSGYGPSDVREEVLKAGGDDFFPKPVVAGDLLAKARKLLRM